MLVLSRKLNEKIVIDGGIVVTVVKIDRNQVRLGIEAPATCASSAKRSLDPRGSSTGEAVGAGRLRRHRERAARQRRLAVIGERFKKSLTMIGFRLDNPGEVD